MKTVLRTLFVWLLLLALPLQGLAAARMLPAVGTAQAGPVSQPAPVAQSCHGMHAATDAGMHTAAPAHEQAAGDHHGKNRGACADCCIVVALMPAPLVPPACAPPSFAIPFRAGHLASVDPVLPERPPRLLAA